MKLEIEVERLTNSYAAKGGSDNTKQQRARMLAFARHCEQLGAYSMAQVGRDHVIKWWKTHRDLTDRTLYEHHRAICILWRLAGKAGQPPTPRYKGALNQTLPSSDVECLNKSADPKIK